MTEQQNVDIVRRGYEAFGKGDVNTLLSLFDEQIEWVSPGAPDNPLAGRRQGRQAVAEFFKAVDEIFDIQQFDTSEFIAQGDRVVVLGHERSTVKSTGQTVETDWVHVFRVANGRVVSFQEYNDTAAFAAAFHGAQATAS